MEDYRNNENITNKIHTVRVTFQFRNYKGYIEYNVGGNIFGLDVLDFNIEDFDNECIDNFVANTCNFKYDEEQNCYSLKLSNNNSEEISTCSMICDVNEINEFVVAIEIVDCKIIK